MKIKKFEEMTDNQGRRVKEMSRCDNCKYYEKCEYADGINFCEDCKEYAECRIRTVFCKAGYDIECNNGFENKNQYCYDDIEGELHE